jgi:hypothetical protein
MNFVQIAAISLLIAPQQSYAATSPGEDFMICAAHSRAVGELYREKGDLELVEILLPRAAAMLHVAIELDGHTGRNKGLTMYLENLTFKLIFRSAVSDDEKRLLINQYPSHCPSQLINQARQHLINSLARQKQRTRPPAN